MTEDDVRPNVAMAEYWNGVPSDAWVSEAERFDAMLAPFGRRLQQTINITEGARVLDVGCGNGALSCEVAGAVGPGGTVVGLDLSAPMLEVARRRASGRGVPATFVQGDAQTVSFERHFDLVMSRFGVMFFDDPTAAFANLATATRSGGRLCFVCWQEVLANEWITVPAAAMVDHVGFPEPSEPDAPGPFALADTERTRHILESAGWSDVVIEAHVEPMRMGSDPEDVVAFMLSDEMGRRLVRGKPADVVSAATEAAIAALQPFATPEGVVLQGASLLVTALKS